MLRPADRIKLAIYLFLVTGSMGFLQPFLPVAMEVAGLSRSQIGLVLGLATAIAVWLQPILGRLSDRLDARRPFIFGCALAGGAGYALLPEVHGMLAILVLVAIGAAGITFMNLAGGVLVGRLSSADSGGAAYARTRVWGSVGYIVVAVITGLALGGQAASSISSEGLERVFRLGAVLFAAIALLSWQLPDSPNSTPREKVHERLTVSPNLRRFFVAVFLYSLALVGATSFIPLYIRKLGGGGLWISGAFVAGVVVEVFVMRWSGRFSDRYGRRPALAVSFLLLPLRMLLYVLAPSPAWVVAVQALHGINFGIMGAISVVFVNDLATDRTLGQAQARLALAGGVAAAVGPMLFGALAQAISLHAMFIVAAITAVLGAGVFVFGVEDSKPESKSVAEGSHPRLRRALAWLDAPPRGKG
jgi:MFS transporter, PPP family, 3-phenylpropionic acid transporter